MVIMLKTLNQLSKLLNVSDGDEMSGRISVMETGKSWEKQPRLCASWTPGVLQV